MARYAFGQIRRAFTCLEIVENEFQMIASNQAERMDSPLFYEDIEVGQTWISPRRTVTESDVINFASMTGDYNPLHVDYDFASKSHYRQPIAHGLLGMSWVAGLGSYFPSVNTLAFMAVRNWEFQRPLYFGDTVHVETTCVSRELSGRRTGKVCWRRKLINERDEVVQSGIFETLVALRTPVNRAHFRTQVQTETKPLADSPE